MTDVDNAFDSLHLMSFPAAEDQQLRGFSPNTDEIFDDIEVELPKYSKVDGLWYEDG